MDNLEGLLKNVKKKRKRILTITEVHIVIPQAADEFLYLYA